jgi:hypothetical protein
MVNMNTQEQNYDNVFPFVIFIENCEETDEPKKETFADFNEAEEYFKVNRRKYSCKIEFYEQDMNERVIRTFATYYGS